jgi:hypothetical protein
MPDIGALLDDIRDASAQQQSCRLDRAADIARRLHVTCDSGKERARLDSARGV